MMKKFLAATFLALGVFTFLLMAEGGRPNSLDVSPTHGRAAVVLVDPWVSPFANLSSSFTECPRPAQKIICDYHASGNGLLLAEYNSRILHRLKHFTGFAALCNRPLMFLRKQNIPHQSSGEDPSVS